MLRWLFVPVLVLLLLALAVGFLDRPAAPAQEEPPVFTDLRLEETSPRAYRLDVSIQGAVISYRVGVRTWGIGTDHGVVQTLAEGDDPQISIDLQLPLDGMSQTACYHVSFFVSAADEKDLARFEDYGLATYACLDANGVTTFPQYDSVQAPPPAPPSDVRIVRSHAGSGDPAWEIEWTNNSTDAIAYDPGILLLDKPWTFDSDAQGLGGIEMPMVPGDWTRAGAINFILNPAGPGVPDSATPRCGYALVLVWAIGPDGPSSFPGNTTVAACFSTAGIHFPAVGPNGVVALPGAGAGTDDFVDHRVRLGAAVALGIVGVLVVLAGAATARR